MSAPKRKQLIWLHQLVPVPVDWLWPGRLAAGKLALLDGDPEVGKSLLALDLAARLSTARSWPDGQSCSGPANTVLLHAEDSVADTILPRLKAARADLTRITVLQGDSTAAGNRCLCFPDDCEMLEEAIGDTAAKLVVIDPFLAFLSASVWSLSDQRVRQAVDPLAQVAHRTGAAIMLVRHLTKFGGHLRALHRGTGAVAIVGAVRTAFLVGRHPDDGEIRLFASSKNNLGPRPPTLAYRIRQEPGEQPNIDWLGESPIAADELAGRPPSESPEAIREAIAFLRDTLPAEGLPAETVYRVARASGIADRTLERAKTQLGVASQQFWEHGNNVWYWKPRECIDGKPLLDQLYEDCAGNLPDHQPDSPIPNS